MALADNYVQAYGQLAEVFKRISEGQAPDKFTRQHLKDIGFGASTLHAVIPLLKALGFLSTDGAPTPRYHAYRDKSRSRSVLGEALREAYSDLFTIKSSPSNADRSLFEGKFKSTHNVGERPAQLMASTFFSLLGLADLDQKAADSKADLKPEQIVEVNQTRGVNAKESAPTGHRPTLHYNIQIHLPATKDIEVFNAIFKSLREHLLD